MTTFRRMVEVGSSDRLLVIGAHAFDAEVMAGGLVATVCDKGGSALLTHMTLGEQGHRTLAPRTYAEQKRTEATEAAKILGADAEFLDYQDTRVPVDDSVALAVCDVIRSWKPSIVVSHWRGSWHKDHRAAYRATVDGLFFAALPTVERADDSHSPSLVLFAENWEDHEGFTPHLFVDISTGFERWMEALRCYELGRGELAAFRYLDYYESLARLHGCVAGVSYAEAFMTMTPVELAGIGQFIGSSAENT